MEKQSTHSVASEDGDLRADIHRRITFGIISIGALFVLGFGWAGTAKLASAVITHGSVVADKNAQKVQHREGGIIADIRTRNGETVRAGQVLIRLDDTQTKAELAVYQSQLVELRARQARLAAERDDVDTIEFPAVLHENALAIASMAGEQRTFTHTRTMREHQKRQLLSRVEQLRHEADGYRMQLKAKAIELEFIRLELEKVGSLAEKGFTPETRVVALKREQARIYGEHGSLSAAIARSEGQVAEVELQILSLSQTVRTEAQKELRSIDARIAELVEREIIATDRLTRSEIRAPLSGIVHELTTHTIGGVIGAGEIVMVIIPSGSPLVVELKLAPADINRVSVGQDVRLRFTSFNQRTTPEVDAKLIYVSADVSRDGSTKQEYFTARATFGDTGQPTLSGKTILPGMPVEAFIVSETRSALSYLVKPMSDHFARAFREE